MAWEVEYTDEFENWWNSLGDDELGKKSIGRYTCWKNVGRPFQDPMPT
jgi:hypothetical protein